MNMGASRAADLDGDGRVDLVVMIKAPFVDTGDGTPVPLDPNATLNTFQPVHFTDVDQQFHIFGSPIKANSINLVDVNGDSLLDVVSYKKPDTYSVALANGAGGWVSQGTITSPATTCPVGRSGGDLDADGRGELIIPTANDCSTSVTVGLDDAGAVVATPSLPVQRDQREVQLADLNGDGLVDAFWLGDTLEISFNTGNGYGPPHTISDPALDSVFALNPDSTKRSAIVMDVNRDGRDDLLFTVRDHYTFNFGDDVFYWNDAVVALLSNGDGSFTRDDLFDVDPGLGLRTADFDGDGRKDLFAVTPDGNLQIYLEHGDDDADLLSSVWDDDASSEPRLQVAYGRTNPADWASATCSFPTLCLRQGSPVVASVWGLDVGSRTYYRFEEPRLDLGGRGFLGYATVRVWNPARPMERTTTFDNVTRVGTVYPNAQRPKSIRTVVPIVNHGAEGIVDKEASGNARISESTFDYELRAPQGGPSHFVFTQATHEREWEESVVIDWNDATRVHITGVDGPWVQGVPREHNASFRVDDYDNLLSVTEATVGGVIHTAEYTYYYRPTYWLIALQATRAEQTYDAGQTPDVSHVLNTYDVFGRLDTSTVEPGGDPDVTVVRSLDYDVRGRLIQETRTAAGQPARARHFDYSDPSGEGVFISQQWDDVDGAITLSKWMYAVPGFGGTMGIIDANGGVATAVHDDLGRPILVTGAGKKPATIAYSAWKHNPDAIHPGGVTAGVEVEVHDGGDAWQVVDTDARGLEVERRHAGFHGVAVVTNAGYDRFGRVLWQSRPDWGTASLARTERVYDSLDRVLNVVAPDGALSTQSYTFFERTATDPQHRVRKIVQDADRRVVTAIDMHDGQPLETTYSYVHGSQPEWVIDPQGNMIHSVFDVRGRRTLLEDPDAGTRATRYDGFGDVVETGDGAGNTTTYTLDRIGRATTIESDTDGTTTLTWDTQPHGLGQIAQTVSPDNTIVDSYYDSIGRPTKTDWTVPGPVVSMFSVEQSYDLDGRVSELRYPYALNRSRMVVTPHYDDGAGGVSLIEATDALGNPFDVWQVADRNADNSLTAAKLGTSIETARSYDAVTGRLATIATIATKGSHGSIADFEYDYDKDGRLMQRRDNVANRVETFAYDDLRRLSEWSLGADLDSKYQYDDLGNLTGVVDKHGVQIEANFYTNTPHQLNKRDGVVYHYDERGRLDGSTAGLAIEYTDFDLPKSTTKDNVTTEFNYDAGHHRVRKAGPSGTTITLGGLYERREDANGTKHVFNIGGPDGMIAQLVYDQAHESEEVEYLHQDQLGSVAVATSPEGKEIDRLFYEPFGRRVDRHGGPVAGPASDVLTGFTGQRHDDDLGLIDMRGRTYDPILRRFLQPDPVIQDAYEGQTYNRYSYVTNDPVNLTDPTGFTAKEGDGWGDDGTNGGSGGLGAFDDNWDPITPPEVMPNADGTGGKLNSPLITVVGNHVDQSGQGAGVAAAAAHADTWYQGSSTDQGLNTGGGGGSGGGPNVGPTGLCGGCSEKDAFSYFYQYGGYVQHGLVYMAAGAVAIATAAVVLPAMTIGGLATGGAGLLEGAAVAAAPAASVATAAAAAAGTPTGQEVLQQAETIAETAAPEIADLVNQAQPAVVNVGGKLGQVLGAMTQEYAAGVPTSAMEALGVVQRATAQMGLEVGYATISENGGIVLQNVGGIVTTIGRDGSLLVERGSDVLLRLAP